MLKKAASVVLASLKDSPYGPSTIRLFARCGLAGSLFEHPAGILIPVSILVRSSCNSSATNPAALLRRSGVDLDSTTTATDGRVDRAGFARRIGLAFFGTDFPPAAFTVCFRIFFAPRGFAASPYVQPLVCPLQFFLAAAPAQAIFIAALPSYRLRSKPESRHFSSKAMRRSSCRIVA